MRISDWSSDVCSSDLLAVDRAIEHARRVDPVMTKRGQEGERAPLSERRFGVEPFPTARPAMGAGHVGFGPGLMDEDKATRLKPTLILLPLHSPPPELWSVLLAGEPAFFDKQTHNRNRV